MDIAGKLNQTGVYWAPSILTGSGNSTYAAGVEVACRIEALDALDKGARGDNSVSETEAFFLPASGIVKDGYLFEGVLADLSPAEQANPQIVSGAFIIREVENIPGLDATETLVEAQLERNS